MSYVREVLETEAAGLLKELYDADIASLGHVANYTKAVSARPSIIRAWRALTGAIQEHQDRRRYELITTFVASKLHCAY